MTTREEIHKFLLAMKRRRLDEGEDSSEVVGETCAELLIVGHLMALKIGITREDIIAHLDFMQAQLKADAK